MKCAVALVLALIGMVVANPVPPLGLELASPILPPVSTVINHGVTIPVVTAPVVRHIVAAPIVTAPIIRTPIYTGYGWGNGWGNDLGSHWGGWSHGGWH
ncbi:unnamed protein product [Arctia plantaginis]|uniref:Uncharacterized protein n=1 Tax=Arctia plantaginis TaxID=874455 RepID=A0A8S1AIU7_ARCPL|nr:unnamed protein product [Arctia plantaginis]